MATMLMDSCITIRVQALKKLPLHFSKHWKIFPRELIKSCLEMVFILSTINYELYKCVVL
jgi:hypothetical protein